MDKRSLVTKEETVVVFTRDGYFKRCQVRSYNSSLGSETGIKQGDVIKGVIKCYTTDYLLAFTSLGNYLFIPVYLLFDTKWKEEGKHINEISSISGNEKIVSGIVVSDFKEGIQVVMVSKLGQVKRSLLKEFEVTRFSRPIRCFQLSSDDSLISAKISHGNDDILILTSSGQASLYNENEVSSVSLRAKGVKAISFGKEKATIVDSYVLEPNENYRLLLLTHHHAIRLVDVKNIIHTARLGMKTPLFKTFKSDLQYLVASRLIKKGEEVSKITAIFKNHQSSEIDLTDVKIQPLDAYLKKNLNFEIQADIEDMHQYDVPSVNMDTRVEIPQKVETIKPEKEDVEQLSLFDYIDDD